MKGARALNKPTKSSKTNCLLELNSYAQTDIETFDKFESSILLIARFFFQANDEPSSKAWKNAFLLAEKYFPPPFGASIAHALYYPSMRYVLVELGLSSTIKPMRELKIA